MISHELVSQQASNDSSQVLPIREQVARTIYDGISEYGTQRYRVYLEEELIGKIYQRDRTYYAFPITEYQVVHGFDTIDTAQDWLVETHYSLKERPITVARYDNITYIFQGRELAGECYYSLIWEKWLLATIANGKIDRQEFICIEDAIARIVSKSLAPQTNQLAKYLVSLESETSFKTEIVETNLNEIDWHNWLARYNHEECQEFLILGITHIN